MELLHNLSLSIVQGLTEFLPISSSAHLILIPKILGWPDQGLLFDVAMHVGTLLAVVIYFHQLLWDLIKAGIKSVYQRKLTDDARVFWMVGFATIPVGLAGLLLKDTVEHALRSPLIIAATSIIFGILLWQADQFHTGKNNEHQAPWWHMMWVGVAQALALLPGTSRSGITMTAALWCGWNREAAARFSFLLAIPVIILAGGLEGWSLVKNPVPHWLLTDILLAITVSCLTALLCIHCFLGWIRRASFLPFAVYRIVLGIVIGVMFY